MAAELKDKVVFCVRIGAVWGVVSWWWSGRVAGRGWGSGAQGRE